MIKILTDTASEFESEEAEKLGLSLLPMHIRFGNEEYRDGFDLSHHDFFERLLKSDVLPQTSQINEYRFAEKFEELTADGSEVLAIVLSSGMSGTYRSALTAAEKFGDKVRVIDSLNASAGERVLVEYALRLREQGLTLPEMVEELENKKPRIRLFGLLDTLSYLRKGGRISAAAAVAGSLLAIKPVITFEKGEVKVVGKAIGMKKGYGLLTQLVEKYGGIDPALPHNLAYSGLTDENLQKYLQIHGKLFDECPKPVSSFLIGSTIGTHIGPNAIAVTFFTKQ